mmetsp:Transcript_9921/g.32832  ORF Transcript_9921/g.32832 Transcript_9921/m.32832 type:complete len:233 (-) Transcript_9921:265-963(-)
MRRTPPSYPRFDPRPKRLFGPDRIPSSGDAVRPAEYIFRETDSDSPITAGVDPIIVCFLAFLPSRELGAVRMPSTTRWCFPRLVLVLVSFSFSFPNGVSTESPGRARVRGDSNTSNSVAANRLHFRAPAFACSRNSSSGFSTTLLAREFWECVALLSQPGPKRPGNRRALCCPSSSNNPSVVGFASRNEPDRVEGSRPLSSCDGLVSPSPRLCPRRNVGPSSKSSRPPGVTR